MYECFVCKHAYVSHACGAPSGQKTASDSLESQLQRVGSHHFGAGFVYKNSKCSSAVSPLASIAPTLFLYIDQL